MTADNNRRIENIIRFGVIAEVDLANCKARVKSGQILTDFLPFLTHRTGTTRTWSPPTVNEQCIILAMSGDLTTAAILTGLYTQNSPSHSADEHVITFADGAMIKYNQASSALTVTGISTAHVTAQTSVTAETPKVICTQDLEVGGNVLIKGNAQINGGVSANGNMQSKGSIKAQQNIESEADVIASGVSLTGHTHTGDSGGTTGTPN
ncbi:TPA: phage baseplate assembly protein V [Pasteurella multocida]|uniref:phage baseplate assembly protein V n=1 Tax=Pasteurella multocida TaxID=747 RepID=UPI0020210E5A|nr:phage baseplate assembly protein V [Pasteurella multocida]MCL7759363.1 phage baseplate assembly protein V [Pasteurella multocida]MEB3481070.1 phage baseplate assembly protein V [Pasteurella multocida]HDR1048076.1 phage baseplate assembly protein V [Pasteurella multocida]HDR1113260.1 phage baseplate assembly protein V [Pasteurella multocida]HDR1140478.1 phage baseplate assembly protein V [Pasteurella multocida]